MQEADSQSLSQNSWPLFKKIPDMFRNAQNHLENTGISRESADPVT